MDMMRAGAQDYLFAEDSGADAVFVVDPRGLTTFVNAAAERTFGFTASELLGQNLHDMLHHHHPDGRPFPASECRTTHARLAGQTLHDLEDLLFRKDGSPVRVTSSVAPLSIGGVNLGVVVTVRDISKAKQAELALPENEARFRGLEEPDIVDTVVADAKRILEANDHCVRMLGYTREEFTSREFRADSSAATLLPKAIGVDRIVRGLDQMLPRVIGEDIEILLRLDAENSLIQADAVQIEQVIMNLAVNAKDAMPEGGKLWIETSAIQVDERLAVCYPPTVPGPYVQMMVSDTGKGVPPEMAARVFGLGLSAAYGIVQQHGGSLSVHSTPGLGTTFRILLPEVRGSAVTEAPRAHEEVAGGSGTVLLVEDEAGVREYVREVLKGGGYSVLEARNGSEAANLALHHRGVIDMLLTDLVLPGATGDQVVRQVRGVRPGIPVLMMSGHSEHVSLRSDTSMPLLQKPFLSAELLRMTRRVLDAGVVSRITDTPTTDAL